MAVRLTVEVRIWDRVGAEGYLVLLELPYQSIDGTLRELLNTYLSAGLTVKDQAWSGRISIPHQLGHGSWDVYSLTPTIQVILADVTYASDQVFSVTEDGLIKIRILVEGRLDYFDSELELDETGVVLECFPSGVRGRYRLASGQRTKLVIINLDPKVLTDDLRLAKEEIPTPLNYIFGGSQRRVTSQETPLLPKLHIAARDMFSAPDDFGEGLLKSYLNAKSSEIACIILKEAMKRTENAKLDIKPRDWKSVEEARAMLLKTFVDPMSIPELAREVGLNQTKLKAAFKAAYGMTIREFVVFCRMDEAATLLGNPDYTVSEVAYKVGYKHPPSFTEAFRKYYGNTPTNFRSKSSPSHASMTDS